MPSRVLRPIAVALATVVVLRLALARQVRSGRIPMGSTDQWPPVPRANR